MFSHKDLEDALSIAVNYKQLHLVDVFRREVSTVLGKQSSAGFGFSYRFVTTDGNTVSTKEPFFDRESLTKRLEYIRTLRQSVSREESTLVALLENKDDEQVIDAQLETIDNLFVGDSVSEKRDNVASSELPETKVEVMQVEGQPHVEPSQELAELTKLDSPDCQTTEEKPEQETKEIEITAKPSSEGLVSKMWHGAVRLFSSTNNSLVDDVKHLKSEVKEVKVEIAVMQKKVADIEIELNSECVQQLRQHYNNQQKIKSEQKEIDEDPYLLNYFQVISHQLTAIWLACMTISSGHIKNGKLTYAGLAAQTLTSIKPALDVLSAAVPGSHIVINIIAAIVYAKSAKDNMDQAALINNMAKFFNMGNAAETIGKLARKLTLAQKSLISNQGKLGINAGTPGYMPASLNAVLPGANNNPIDTLANKHCKKLTKLIMKGKVHSTNDNAQDILVNLIANPPVNKFKVHTSTQTFIYDMSKRNSAKRQAQLHAETPVVTTRPALQ